MIIGLINEGKTPPDSRVALTPQQCKWLQENYQDLKIVVESSKHRCFTDAEYARAGIDLVSSLDDCDILFGIKEVPVKDLLADKTYFFFSHTKKLQPYNQAMLKEIIGKNITLIDYECLEHEDGARIIGFGFFAGVVGAHNGMMAYGQRSGAYHLGRVHEVKSFNRLIHTYFGLKLPHIKIAVTGSGRVAHGILEIMNLLGIHEAEPEDYLQKEFKYPVYVHRKGADLYERKDKQPYKRNDFHENPETYESTFLPFTKVTDILMNGIYWEENIPRLFEMEEISKPGFRIQTIADITDDKNGSVPCNLGDSTIPDPVYGVDKISGQKTEPYVSGSIDVMAVGNLPNELPRDASKYFGEQLIKYILPDLLQDKGKSEVLKNATIIEKGKLTKRFDYMKNYAGE